MKPKFQLIIEWSDEDRCYVARSPDLGARFGAHGGSYAACAKKAEAALKIHWAFDQAQKRRKKNSE